MQSRTPSLTCKSLTNLCWTTDADPHCADVPAGYRHEQEVLLGKTAINLLIFVLLFAGACMLNCPLYVIHV